MTGHAETESRAAMPAGLEHLCCTREAHGRTASHTNDRKGLQADSASTIEALQGCVIYCQGLGHRAGFLFADMKPPSEGPRFYCRFRGVAQFFLRFRFLAE